MNEQPSLFEMTAKPDAQTEDSRESLMLARFAEQAYLDYAISVVKGRALPDVCDGQKPVQRRILYAMNELRLSSEAKPRKSAAVVGDVLGKLHPHGDQSVYDALVRMAQDFTMRYPLVDGHGNFGSRDGDGAAAMRYTEARLTPVSQLLLSEINQGTVEFQDNYDGSSLEPAMLPARLPMTLMNGASGIAVGMATEIPSHNLQEVADATIALIQRPDLPHEELMQILPGPDFPGGGQIISSADAIAETYASGRGSLKVRARWKIEELARGQWQAVITELSPGTSTQKVLQEIEELTNPKVRSGKKSLSAEQTALKQQFLNLLDTVRDESGRDSPVRIVLEPKSRRLDPETFMQTLLAHTSLEGNTPVNLVMIGIDGRPQQKGLGQILKEWIEFRFDTVRRRTRWRLRKVDERIHILEGRIMVLLNIDEVIQIIRESDDPKTALMTRFRLTDIQAEDILEIRLRQLARLEKIKIEQELSNLQKEKGRLQEVLDKPATLRRLIIREIEADKKQFGDARRTLIQEEAKASVEQQIADDPVTVIVSNNGWLRMRQGHALNLTALTFKQGDSLYGIFECRTTDVLLAFSNKGRIYSIPVHQLPGGRGDGTPVTTFAEVGIEEDIVHYYAGKTDTSIMLAMASGYGFISTVGDMTSRIKNGKSFINLEENDTLLPPAVLTDDQQWIAVLSGHGRVLVFERKELRSLASGGRGTTLISLEPNEKLLSFLPVDGRGCMVVCQSGKGKRYQVKVTVGADKTYNGKRGRKGRIVESRFTPIGLEPLPVSGPDSE
ncbi:MAG: DNA topoisomerase IV subunit A [Oxalobacter sp.]|nr:DNA topoisomerase IV subunit A [Oxalobacter sp.]